jgi:methanogenic corrinoid protein MtbC1
MTAYRYVRLGMLSAEKVGAEWQVRSVDLDAFKEQHDNHGHNGGRSHRDAPWSDRLRSRLLAGDERGSWQVVEAALASGFDPASIYTDVVSPAMRSIGDDWARGESSIVAEHRATAIVTRIVGRLSSRFTHRGRRRGRVVIGTPAGEAHALPVAMVADMLRGAGFEVIDLGHDLPADSFAQAVVDAGPVTAVAVSITNPDALSEAKKLIASLRSAASTPIVVGGFAVDGDDHARRLGADAYAADGPAAVALAESFVHH